MCFVSIIHMLMTMCLLCNFSVLLCGMCVHVCVHACVSWCVCGACMRMWCEFVVCANVVCVPACECNMYTCVNVVCVCMLSVRVCVLGGLFWCWVCLLEFCGDGFKTTEEKHI